MAKDVLCEVDTCVHWHNGNKCAAEQIYITSQEKAHTSAETDCKTFEVK
jgi:hypothetical protein